MIGAHGLTSRKAAAANIAYQGETAGGLHAIREVALGKKLLSPIQTVLVVVPDQQLRRSIEFALDAEGFRVDSHPLLSAALGSPDAATAICVIVDENAIMSRPLEEGRLERFTQPVILLVDRLRAVPRAVGISVLKKPLLGRMLVDTVVGTVASAAPRAT